VTASHNLYVAQISDRLFISRSQVQPGNEGLEVLPPFISRSQVQPGNEGLEVLPPFISRSQVLPPFPPQDTCITPCFHPDK